MLTRLASVGLLGSVSSSADLTKEAASNDTSDEEDSAVDIASRPNSNYSNLSNFSSDCYSLARTISTGSTVSTVFAGSASTDNLVRDNLAFVDERPPTYNDVSEDIINEEVCSIFFLENVHIRNVTFCSLLYAPQKQCINTFVFLFIRFKLYMLILI